jgi:hypothetical protein
VVRGGGAEDAHVHLRSRSPLSSVDVYSTDMWGEGGRKGGEGEVAAFLLSAGDGGAKSQDELQTALLLLRKAVALDQDREHIERRLRHRILLLEEQVERSKTDIALYKTECEVMRRRDEGAEMEMKTVVQNLKEEVSDKKRLLEETQEATVQSQEKLSETYRRLLHTQEILELTQQTLNQSEERLQHSGLPMIISLFYLYTRSLFPVY